MALAWIFGLIGATFLPIASLEGEFILWGAGLIAVSVAAGRVAKDFAAGSARARAQACLLMGAYLVLTVASGAEPEGLIVPLALAGSVVGLLWVPESSRVHFGDAADPTSLGLAPGTTHPPNPPLPPHAPPDIQVEPDGYLP